MGAILTLSVAGALGHASPVAHAAALSTSPLISLGSTTFPTVASGTDASVTSHEFAGGSSDGAASLGRVNRSLSTAKGKGHGGTSGARAKSNPTQIISFNGLNHRQNRLASGGNQFTLEPPDQGLCAGNGYVVEATNDVLAVYNQSGATLAGPTGLNAFYKYAPAINRSTGVAGPFLTDPSCYYDQATQRFFMVVLTLDTNPDGSFTLANHLDIAVSKTADPTAGWNLYSHDVTNDGSIGTEGGACPCLGDYPHIGADQNGFYITTNAYPWGPGNFDGAQVYAMSKSALASGASNVAVTHLDTTGMVAGKPGFTVWPATSPANDFETSAGGTEYFLSSMAADEAGNHTGTDNRIAVWALTNTRSLVGSTPAISLSNVIVNVAQYGNPPNAAQKSGPNPTGQYFYGTSTVGQIATNDSRMLTTTFANGKLWGALNTDLQVNGQDTAGVSYYIIKPSVDNGGLSAKLALQGDLVGDNGASPVFPSIGVTPSGRGIISFTLTGPNDFPSAAYASMDAKIGAGPIVVAAAGLGPQDGFSEYGGRPRWGDYGATAVDGNTIWMASEYIAQTCDLNTALSTGFSCGGTRTALANWATRITAVNSK